MALQADVVAWPPQHGLVLRAMNVVAGVAAHALRPYIWLWTKSLPCIRFLCAVPSGQCVKRFLAEVMLLEHPDVAQPVAGLVADRPVVVDAVERFRARLSLRMALDADVVGADGVQLRRD